MTVTVHVRDNLGRELPGPADLHAIGPGEFVVISGEHKPDDLGPWAGAIGMAVLRGVRIERV
ncbi:hypothetical protein [Micromonospora sp. WMMD980]|uniref:hypothetical protein n=1 Tax=Micromonospora sp. WMMD980 TaxID=3016088 RepID=UPI0024174A98|nr:hypothetical protein [Micromonospora sp. WMMD980]MDG4801740.1 hypothetical protein [Micromonospora sp. WMMD980]